MNWPTAFVMVVFFALCAFLITVFIGAVLTAWMKKKEPK